jgi:hypothetical protein
MRQVRFNCRLRETGANYGREISQSMIEFL